MRRFMFRHIIRPFGVRWFTGLVLLTFWTVAFIALPALSGWFLAACSLAFITSNILFAYLIPSSIIRFMTLLRTVTRYFERLGNHKTTLSVQRNLQLKVFQSVARLPYFRKQVSNNASILENSTYGIDQVLNHVLLWIMPLIALILALILSFLLLQVLSLHLAVEYVVASALLLFILPQLLLSKNRRIYKVLKNKREEQNQTLIQSFRGRIEIMKYHLENKARDQQRHQMLQIEALESRLQRHSFLLQLFSGLGMGFIALYMLWNSGNYAIAAPVAIGIFFGIMAQAELLEMLFSGKSEQSSVAHQIKDLEVILSEASGQETDTHTDSTFGSLVVEDLVATIPETSVVTSAVTFEANKGDWIALYGQTGIGKTTLLNSLFHPEYQRSGSLLWNGEKRLPRLPVPACIYVTQKAYLLTGTLRENFEGYTEAEIFQALETVDLTSWYQRLPDGLNSWLGEDGETLSGGQRKKLLLAQALLKKPQLLVVDEPTAGISTDNAVAIFRNIRKQHPELTILMATHLKAFENEVDKAVRM